MPTKTARATMLWPMLSDVHVRERGDRPDVVEAEAVAGVHDEPVAVRPARPRAGGRASSAASRGGCQRLAVAPGVQLDDRRAARRPPRRSAPGRDR